LSERDPEARSIHEFLTDGSLARLCEQLSLLGGIPVQLRDESGNLIVPGDGEGTWDVRAPGESGAVGADADSVPIEVDGETIGSLVLCPGGEPARRASVLRCLELLGATSADLCGTVLELRESVREVEVLYELTSLLVRAHDVKRVLEVALDSALEILGLDAGAIVLFNEVMSPPTGNEELDVETKVSRGLSEEWVGSPLPLSKDRLFDRLALAGEVVVSEDLLADERVLSHEHVRREGVRACINAGLVFRGEPIGVMRLYARDVRSFGETERRLMVSIGQQAALSVEQARLLRAQRKERQIQRQLSLAADVQQRMMPRKMPSVPGLDVAARYRPSTELGGDFYDVFTVGENLGLVVGDVVGKGVAAALFMSLVRATLRAHVQDVYDIDVVMQRVNERMCADSRVGEFVTLWYGVVEPRTNRLTFTSAGHDPALLFRASGALEELATGNLVVGVDETAIYDRGVSALSRGDTLVLYTDGVPDARSFEDEKFGKARMIESVRAFLEQEPDASAEAVVERLLWSLRQFTGLSPRTDDVTLVVLRAR